MLLLMSIKDQSIKQYSLFRRFQSDIGIRLVYSQYTQGQLVRSRLRTQVISYTHGQLVPKSTRIQGQVVPKSCLCVFLYLGTSWPWVRHDLGTTWPWVGIRVDLGTTSWPWVRDNLGTSWLGTSWLWVWVDQGRFYVGARGGTGPPNVGQAPQIFWF